jgi:hypothetical protein
VDRLERPQRQTLASGFRLRLRDRRLPALDDIVRDDRSH